MYKLCNVCDNWFPCTEEHFHKNKCSKRDGLFPYCKKCASKKAFAWGKVHHKRKLELNKRVELNPERILSHQMSERKRREKGLYREWQRNNMDKCIEYNRKWHTNKQHEITDEELQALYEYCNSSCMYCGMSEEDAKREFGCKLFRDHFENDGSNGIDNCVLCCKRCSSSKYNNSFDEWYTKNNPVYDENRYQNIMYWINSFKSE